VVNLLSRWTDPDTAKAQIGWGRDVYAALEEHTTGGAYVNFLGDEGPDRVRAAYGEDVYARLQALKRTYDPRQRVPPQPERRAGLGAWVANQSEPDFGRFREPKSQAGVARRAADGLYGPRLLRTVITDPRS